MCLIIGIHGRKGAGRKTAAWLLAKTIEEIRKGTSYEKYKILYKCWVELVIADASEASSTDHVILDSFGEHILDQVKQFCPNLIPYDLHDEETINRIYINPVTFELINPVNDAVDIMPLHADTVYNRTMVNVRDSTGECEECWMTLSEFIMYYAHFVMKTFFGKDVWLNVASTTASAMGSDDIRIYWDCKTQAELSYISQNKGIIIEVTSPDRESDGGFRDVQYVDPDYEINSHLGLEYCASKFWGIANNIYKH
jgi:hypothetical protein